MSDRLGLLPIELSIESQHAPILISFILLQFISLVFLLRALFFIRISGKYSLSEMDKNKNAVETR